MISIFIALWAVAGVALAAVAVQEGKPPAKGAKAVSLDQILDRLADSTMDRTGLGQSNDAIDQLVERSNKLMRKAANERDKKMQGSDPHPALGQVLGQMILALTDANAYLLKLKELQSALMAGAAAGRGRAVDTHQICRDLNREFKAVWTDLTNLKLAVKTLPLAQRAIADVILWEAQSRLHSAIHRIRLRTIRVGAALALEADLDLEAR
jgi:hypothetical protein